MVRLTNHSCQISLEVLVNHLILINKKDRFNWNRKLYSDLLILRSININNLVRVKNWWLGQNLFEMDRSKCWAIMMNFMRTHQINLCLMTCLCFTMNTSMPIQIIKIDGNLWRMHLRMYNLFQIYREML